MFAYCNNNPVMYCDSCGTRIEAASDKDTIGFGVPSFPGSIVFGEAISDIWDKITASLKSKAVIAASITREYRSSTENHHIVAQGSYLVNEARTIMVTLYGTYNDAENMIPLKTAFHRRIHTQVYYAITNTLVVNAYESAHGNHEEQKANVSATLKRIRGILDALNLIAEGG